MIVMPAAAAARTPALTKLGWKLLLPANASAARKAPSDLRVDLPDPAQSAAGLATLIEVSRLLGSDQGGPAGVHQVRPYRGGHLVLR